jgi:hypothetical protein
LVIPSSSRRRHLALWAAALAATFLFRLAFGLSRELFFEDETQIFLMGLRYYATGAWPYFGADIVWTKSEIPGALQALLVGLPFHVVAVPEAPYVLLNILSMAALAWFAWYVKMRLPQLPAWLVWTWLMTLPWTLEFSAHIINPSYVLAPAIAFFIAFFEAVPALRRGALPVPLAFAVMGAALTWVVQIHMSWPLLLPYIGCAWLAGWRSGPRALALHALAFVGGTLLTGALLAPTLLVYGLHAGGGGTLKNLQVHPVSPWIAVTTLARIFSFASLEVWRFIATDEGKRTMLLLRHLWIAPLLVVVWAAGIWQPIWMLREWLRARSSYREWVPLKWLVAATVALVYVSYWFVLEPSQAHAFYVVAPVGFMFAAYCWTFVDSPRWRRIAAAILVTNVIFHAALAWIQAPEHSLYRNRAVVAEAVRLKQPEMFAHRRAFAIDAGPVTLQDPSRPYHTLSDVQFDDIVFTLGPRRVSLWTLTLRINNPRVAFRDIVYLTNYRDAHGAIVEQRSNYIKAVFQPGDVTRLEVNDGIVAVPFASATIEMVGAEALLPMQ